MKHAGRTLAVFLLTLALGLMPGMNLAALGESASGSKSDIDTPLTLEAKTDGTIVVKHPMVGMQYSKNGARTVVQSTDDITIDVTEGDSVQFFGKGTEITRYGDSDSAINNRTKITGGTAQCYIYGNIMSLVDENGFSTARALTGYSAFAYLFEKNGNLYNHGTRKLVLPATTLTEYCYCKMFSGCSALTAAPDLPAATLTKHCYLYMFADCTSLKAAPRLDARTLAANCCESMFSGCSALTAAPDLPADSLAAYCYKSMFYRCSALAAAPRLDARTLAANCYVSMFQLCSSLTAAPVLPAPKLVDGCYLDMFKDCTKLNAVTCLATDIAANNATLDWLSSVSATGTFVKPPMQSWPTGASGIPSGWTVNDYVAVTGVTLSKSSLSLSVGDSATLKASVQPSDATEQGIVWSSGNTAVATVSNSGVVKAVAEGTATITAASVADSNKKATCTVTVTASGTVLATSIKLNKTQITVKVGQTAKLTRTILPENVTITKGSYKVSDKTVFTVQKSTINGNKCVYTIKGVGVGTAKLTVYTEDGSGLSASCSVKVVKDDIPVSSVSLSSSTLTLDVGGECYMPATVLPENATDRSVIWSSSNTSVATVNDSIVYAIAPGTAVIKATAASDSSKYATCKVTVKAAVPEKKLTKTGSNGTVSLEKGEQLQLIPTFATKKGWTIKSYASSNKKIATVSASGLVTAKKAGTATITVKTKNGKKATLKIKVVDPTAPTKVKLNKTGTVKLKKGKTLQLTATVYPDTAVTTLTWKSSNKKVATVSKDGVVKGLKKGTATITVKTKNGKTATVKIKVVS